MAAVCLTAGAAGAAEALVVKVGGTVAQRALDEERCDDAAKEVKGDASIHPAQGFAGGIVDQWLMQAGMDGYERKRARKFCLENLGYYEVGLIEAEEAAYRRARGRARDDWQNQFMADPALRTRIEAAKAVLPDLPAYRGDDGPVGSFRHEPLVITTPDGQSLKEGEAFAAAQASRLLTAVLREGFADRGVIAYSAAAGTVFHQVDYRVRWDNALVVDDNATWCGMVDLRTVRGPLPEMACFVKTGDRYDMFNPPVTRDGIPVAAGPGVIFTHISQPLNFDVREQDDLDLKIELVLSDLSRRAITVTPTLSGGGASRQLPAIQARFDANGLARIETGAQAFVFTLAPDGSVRVTIENA